MMELIPSPTTPKQWVAPHEMRVSTMMSAVVNSGPNSGDGCGTMLDSLSDGFDDPGDNSATDPALDAARAPPTATIWRKLRRANPDGSERLEGIGLLSRESGETQTACKRSGPLYRPIGSGRAQAFRISMEAPTSRPSFRPEEIAILAHAPVAPILDLFQRRRIVF